MKNKFFTIGFSILFLLILSACGNKSFQLEDDEITIKVGETYQINLSEGKLSDLAFSDYNQTLLSVSENGLITAISEGVTVITVTHKKDDKLTHSITVNIRKIIQLSSPQQTIQMMVGDQLTVDYESNDAVEFLSSNTSLLDVSAIGLLHAKSEGSVTVTIRSTYDSTVSIMITVNILKVVDINIDENDISLVNGFTHQIIFESNEEVIFSSSNSNIASVNAQGLVTANQIGEATITIKSSYNEDVFELIIVRVFNEPTAIEIVSYQAYNIDVKVQIGIAVTPIDGFPLVRFESSNPLVADFDEEGFLNTKKAGITIITAYSIFDDSIVSTKAIEIFNYILVDTTSSNPIVTYKNLMFSLGKNYFNTLNDALNNATLEATIFIINGTHNSVYDLNTEGIKLIGDGNAIITGTLNIGDDHIEISNLTFSSTSKIRNNNTIHHFTFSNNTVENITHNEAFILLDSIYGTNIHLNTFSNLTGHGIVIENYLGGDILVSKNTINSVQTAISVTSNENFESTTTIKVTRNILVNVHTGFIIETKDQSILAYARFNSIQNYSIGAKNEQANKVDFTLNHWGASMPDYGLFVGVSESMLRGYYQTQASIPTEAQYNPDLPIKIEINNPISEMEIGDTHQFQISFLPLEFTTERIRWITSNPLVLMVSSNGTLTPLKSGVATITVRSSVTSSINTPISITVLTDPGIELSLSKKENTIITGDTVNLLASPFPYNISTQTVFFESMTPNVATITQDGLITTLSPGVVTIKASLLEDPTVFNTFTIEVFDSLDPTNLMDLLTMYSLTQSKYLEWLQYGVGFNYMEQRYESVSRYHFQENVINQSKMLPVFYAIRPGEPMDPHPVGITQYNPYNVYWVVMHETAGTNPGAGALSHANYLWNETAKGSLLWVSWHFTVGHNDIYQSLPETERGFHAGDGSSRPGTSATYLGGGNRNGIGIEMSVAQDEDMFRTLHKAAKLASGLLVKYNLPQTHMKYHRDFSGKICPQGLIMANMLPLLETLAEIEYLVAKYHSDAEITFESHTPEYLDNTGRVIKFPSRAVTASYTVTITQNNVTTSRTFYTYLPGTDI
jgi:N-acetylmuramoyl-L-alanine amidase